MTPICCGLTSGREASTSTVRRTSSTPWARAWAKSRGSAARARGPPGSAALRVVRQFEPDAGIPRAAKAVHCRRVNSKPPPRMCRQITAGRGFEPGLMPLGRYNSAGIVLFCATGLCHGRRIREPIDAKRLVLTFQLDAVTESLACRIRWPHGPTSAGRSWPCDRHGRHQASRNAEDDATQLRIQQHG